MTDDPIERATKEALQSAGVRFECNVRATNGRFLDFYLPDFDLYIEVKQFHSERITTQIAGLENVIVIQGRPAAAAFRALLEARGL